MHIFKNKSLMIALCALFLGLVLCIFLLLKDDSILLSPQEFYDQIAQNRPAKIELQRDEIIFTQSNQTYRVARDGVQLSTLDPSIIIEPKYSLSVLDEIVLLVLIFLGLGVLLRFFFRAIRPAKRESPFDINALNLSGSISPQNVPNPLANLNMTSSLNKSAFSESGDFSQTESKNITFKDVAGISEVKEELAEIIDYLKNTKKYQSLGIRLPKGVLLVGPPGVGKTMIAKAVAGEAGVPFLYQSGSSFVQIYVGMGAKRVRELFARAKIKSPSIIFIDEIDAVGKSRGGNRNDEREATLNQLLTEMDGFEDSSGVIVIAATNKIDVLDEALLRSGRFDRRIYVDLPDFSERVKIFEVYLNGKKYNFDVSEIARLCVGFSGAAIASLVNESALSALRRNSVVIEREDILGVKDKVLLGKKKILSFDEEEKTILATYQSAKALSAYWLDIDFEKIALVSESFKELDKEIIGKSEMLNKIKLHLAGSVALELVFGQNFSCAKDDLEKAKLIAREMCESFGMGAKIYADIADMAGILESCKNEMCEYLGSQKALLSKISDELLKSERLSKDEIKKIVDEHFS